MSGSGVASEPKRGAYGTTSLTTDQISAKLQKLRPPVNHWSDWLVLMVSTSLNIALMWYLVPVSVIIESTVGWDSFFALILSFFAFSAHIVPAFWVWEKFKKVRQERWISEKRKKNIEAWEVEYSAAYKYETDLALYVQTQTELGRDYWLNAKGIDLESKLQAMLNRLGGRMNATTVSGDGGIDLRGVFRNEETLIQCKGLAKNCGVAVIRDAAGVKSLSGSHMVVCCPKGFTKGSIIYAHNTDIELWDVDHLVAMAAVS